MLDWVETDLLFVGTAGAYAETCSDNAAKSIRHRSRD